MRAWKRKANAPLVLVGVIAAWCALIAVQTPAFAQDDPSFVLLEHMGPVGDWLRGGHHDYCDGACPVGTKPTDVPKFLSNPSKVGKKSVFVNLMGLHVRPAVFDAMVGSEHLRNLYLPNTNANDAACAKIATCPNLYCLDLSWDEITPEGLKEIAKLEHLHILKLRGVAITPEMAQALASMPVLDYLDVSSTDADSVRNIFAAKGFANLRTLSLQATDFTDFPQVSESPMWPKLYTVALDQSSHVDRLVNALGQIKSLRNIRAFQTKDDTRSGLRNFGKQRGITVFDEDYIKAH